MKLNYLNQSLFVVLLMGSAASRAMSPAELQKLQAAGEKITIVDLRNNEVFKKGHIPGAINVPASIVSEKSLPPLGRVVAYDDGLGRDSVAPAVAALNQKNGIRAEALEGGFAAWEMSRASTTIAPGMDREKIAYITYDQLKETRANDLVLVDLRKAAKSQNDPSQAADVLQTPLSDLSKIFPNARVTKSAFDATQKQGAPADAPKNPPLLVLIDSGDGSAQATARALKGSGNQRVVILAGGEEIIARAGQPGLQRQGFGQEALSTNVPTSQSK